MLPMTNEIDFPAALRTKHIFFGLIKVCETVLLSFLTVSNFSLHLIIFLGLLLTLPKDSAGVGDVKKNSQKAEIKIQIKSFFKNQSWMAKSSSVMIQ